jgi:hypothetical protein
VCVGGGADGGQRRFLGLYEAFQQAVQTCYGEKLEFGVEQASAILLAQGSEFR